MRNGAFALPIWGERSPAGAAAEYDVASAPIIQSMRDRIVTEALALLSDRLDCGAALALPADPPEPMTAMKVPAARAHVDWHLRRAVAALAAPSGPDEHRLQRLEIAWRNLVIAGGENGRSIVDLSQCCCGIGSHLSERHHGL